MIRRPRAAACGHDGPSHLVCDQLSETIGRSPTFSTRTNVAGPLGVEGFVVFANASIVDGIDCVGL
jgi:hypothetical protein